MTIRTGVLACALGAVIMLPVRADEPVNLKVSFGLWEVVTHPQVSGNLDMSADVQNLPPEQRARVQAMMQQMMANAQKPRTFRECMTREKLSHGWTTGQPRAGCKRTVLSNTRTELAVHEACTGQQDGPSEVTMHFRMSDPEHVTGTVDATQMHRGTPVKVHETVEGHFVGKVCGSVNDAEPVHTP